MSTSLFPPDVHRTWDIRDWRHGTAILATEFPDQFAELVAVMRDFRLLRSHIVQAGGRKSPIAQVIDDAFAQHGWKEHSFDVRIVVDKHTYKTATHAVDYFKNRIAVETEWNNKDPFYHRDLNNFRLLFDARVISVGVVVTRSSELQTIFNQVGKGKSYGQSTTHMGKLLPIVESDNVGGCPLIALGITERLYDPNN